MNIFYFLDDEVLTVFFFNACLGRDSLLNVLFGLFLVVYLFCFLSGAGVDLFVMVEVCVLVDVFALLGAFFSVCGGRIVGC